MTDDIIVSVITHYNYNKAKAEYLTARIEQLKREFEMVLKQSIDAIISPKAQVITDEPRGNQTSDKVGNIATKIADGWIPDECKEINAEIDETNYELHSVQTHIRYVNAWLSAMPDKCAFVIRHQMIDNEIWSNIEKAYQAQYGIYANKQTLRRIRRHGLDIIHDIVSTKGCMIRL